jgi:hypothetical protein
LIRGDDPSDCTVRSRDVQVEDRDCRRGSFVLGGGNEPSPFVPIEVDAGDDHRHADERRGERERHLVFDRLEERPVALVAVGVDSDLFDELVEVVV